MMENHSNLPAISGTVVLEADAIILRRSPYLYLKSQVSRWRQGGLANRAGAFYSLIWAIAGPLLAVLYIYLTLSYAIWLSVGALWIVHAWFLQVVRTRKIPLERLEAGVSTSGERKIQLPTEVFGRLGAIGRLWTRPTITFIHEADRDEVVSYLERRGVPVA